jgi:hypothetical protein
MLAGHVHIFSSVSESCGPWWWGSLVPASDIPGSLAPGALPGIVEAGSQPRALIH